MNECLAQEANGPVFSGFSKGLFFFILNENELCPLGTDCRVLCCTVLVVALRHLFRGHSESNLGFFLEAIIEM